MNNGSNKRCKKITAHFMFNNFFFLK